MKKIKNRYTAAIDVQEVLCLHSKWLLGWNSGQRANLAGADLTGAVLTGDRFKWRNHTRFSCRPEGEKRNSRRKNP